MGDDSAGTAGVSIFAMVLIAIVVIVVLFFVFRGFFGGKKEVDINVNPGGGSILLDKNDIAYNFKLQNLRIS